MVAVVRRHGLVSGLHHVDPFAERTLARPEVWWCDFSGAAIVLGSRQTPDLLDREQCELAGLEIVRRRSGGGAVLLRPHDVTWIDVVLPHGVAPDDVRGSMVWVGDRWLEAVAPTVAAGADLTVHRGGMRCTAWSELVCFAGIGPGEVLVDGRKLVGLSQRRTRSGLRIQGLVHHRSLAAEMPRLFSGGLPTLPLEDPAVLERLAAESIARRLAALIDTS